MQNITASLTTLTLNDMQLILMRQKKRSHKSSIRRMSMATGALLVLSSLLAVESGAEAAAGEGEPTPSYVLEEVHVAGTRADRGGDSLATIATKLPIPTQLTPASIGIVSQPLIEAQGGRILGDALQNVSGVNVQTGFGVFDFFTIRGFDSLTSGMVLSDGVPEPEVSFYDLYNVERVEVLKGPAAFLYGGNPLSGAVNLQRKQPTSEPFLHVSAGAGRFSRFRGALDAGGPVGMQALGITDINYRLNAEWRDADNFRDDKESGSFAINPVIAWQLAEGHQVSGQVEFVASEYKSDAGIPVLGGALADVPRTRSYQSPLDLSDQQLVRVRVDYQKRLNESAVLRDKVYFTHLDWKSKGSLLTIPALNRQGELISGHVGRNLTLLDDDQKLVGNQLELAAQGHTGSAHHQLLLGLEIARLVDDYALDVAPLPSIDLVAPQETVAEPLFILPIQAGSARHLTRAAYLVDAVSLTDQYRLFVGGRLDAIGYEDKVNGIDQDFNEFSPMIGLLHAPTPNLSFYVSAGRGFAPPSSLGRGDRRAEESEQIELGAKRRWNDAGSATLAVYHLQKDVASDDGVTARRGSQQARGIEAELSLARSPWVGVGSYAFSAGELKDFVEELRVPTPDGGLLEQSFDRSKNEPAFAPRHLFNLWLNRHFTGVAKGASAGVGLRYVGKQFSGEDNAHEIADVLLVDVAVSYRQGPANLRLRLANLTDRNYETRGFGSASVIPADPFSVRASVDWTW